MDKKECERIWKEMVDSSKRREEKVVLSVVKRDWGKEKGGWRKGLVSDLKLLVILEVIGCGLFVILELLKY